MWQAVSVWFLLQVNLKWNLSWPLGLQLNTSQCCSGMFCNIDSQTHTHFFKKKFVVYQLSRDHAPMKVESTIDMQYKVIGGVFN